MKTLLVLRHGKSDWSDEDVADHDRPLKKRGRRDAPRMGRLLAEAGLIPDLIVSSTARRARETAFAVAEASGYGHVVHLDSDLYEASPERIAEVIGRTAPETARRVLVVGHNPGLESFVERMAAKSVRLPTAALVWLELPIERWSALEPDTRASIREVWRPKELED